MKKILLFLFINILIYSLSYAKCNLRLGVFPCTNAQKIANDYFLLGILTT